MTVHRKYQSWRRKINILFDSIKEIRDAIQKKRAPSLNYVTFRRRLSSIVSGYDSLLDIGCGADSPLAGVDVTSTIGLDIYPKCVSAARQNRTHDLIIQSTASEAEKIFGTGSVEAVAALNVIEHMTREEGFKLLADIERIASKLVIIMSCVGWMDQDAFDGNPWQIHKSAWVPDDFRKRGYLVFGEYGMRYCRDDKFSLRRPKAIWQFISLYSQGKAYYNADKAQSFIALKPIGE